MTAVRVILITVAGPGGHVDLAVRSDVSPAELAASLRTVIGVSQAWPAAEHRAPPRPPQPRGRRAWLSPGASLAEAGVADGDLVLFRPEVAAAGRAGHPGAQAGPPGAQAGPPGAGAGPPGAAIRYPAAGGYAGVEAPGRAAGQRAEQEADRDDWH